MMMMMIGNSNNSNVLFFQAGNLANFHFSQVDGIAGCLEETGKACGLINFNAPTMAQTQTIEIQTQRSTFPGSPFKAVHGGSQVSILVKSHPTGNAFIETVPVCSLETIQRSMTEQLSGNIFDCHCLFAFWRG